jgi:hypothetical protein
MDISLLDHLVSHIFKLGYNTTVQREGLSVRQNLDIQLFLLSTHQELLLNRHLSKAAFSIGFPGEQCCKEHLSQDKKSRN